MAFDFLLKVKDFLAAIEKGKVSAAEDDLKTGEDSSSSVARALMGSSSVLSDYYFPSELIGGCCPRVVGEEEGIVWNAAAEAADTERVHVVWQASGEKVWYLAIRASEMSAHSSTWCPFASLLPGMRDAAQPPTVYTHFSDESATMMTVLPDALQIHRGTTSVIRAKAERMARELEGAPVIELIPDRIAKLTPVPWYSLSLFEDRARRILAAFSIFLAMVFSGLAVIVWLIAAMTTVSLHADLGGIQQRTEKKSLQLLRAVQEQRASPMREQLAKFSDINDGLLALNGYLEIYVIEKDKANWRAVLPANVTADRIRELGGQTLDATDQGVVVGDSKESLSLGENTNKRKK